jgi:prepilin-type N-terminal cleavage/methylation domain-containing protein
MRSSLSPRSGMTLLELIVGLSITGMAITAGYSALATLITNGDRAGNALDATLRVAGERRALTQWLAGARLMLEESGPSFSGLDGIDEHRPSDDLTFLTTGPTPLGIGNTVVRLYVDRDTLTPERGLVAEFGRWPRQDRKRLEIDARVDGMDVGYFTRMLNEPEWLPSWVSNTVLPGAVEVRLSPAAGDSLPALLALPLVVAIGYD